MDRLDLRYLLSKNDASLYIGTINFTHFGGITWKVKDGVKDALGYYTEGPRVIMDQIIEHHSHDNRTA